MLFTNLDKEFFNGIIYEKEKKHLYYLFNAVPNSKVLELTTLVLLHVNPVPLACLFITWILLNMHEMWLTRK